MFGSFCTYHQNFEFLSLVSYLIMSSMEHIETKAPNPNDNRKKLMKKCNVL